MQVIQTKSKLLKKSLIGFFGAASASSLLALPLLSISPVSASSSFEYQVNVNTSLNVTVSSPTVSLTLNPSITPFANTDLDVTVGTNNPWGYRLYINTDYDEDEEKYITDLINDTYADDAYINTLSSTATGTITLFPANKWGYRVSELSTGVAADGDITDTTGTYFYPFASGTLIGSSSTPSNEANTKLTFGAKVNYERPAGVYSLDFSFKAIPDITTLTMQDLDGDVCTTTGPTLVTDSRDGQTYAIMRLADGKCWMLQNLKLGKTQDNIVLTSADSNVSNDGFTLSSNEAGAEGKFPAVSRTDDTVAYPEGGTVYVKDKSEYYCTDAYGCYYNWYTATAGSGKGEGDSATGAGVTVNYSICPKGWSLPTGGEGGQFQALATAYGGTSATAAANMSVANPTTTTENINGQYAPGLLLGGGYYSGGAVSVGTGGYYWSRTSYSIGHVYYLYINTSDVGPLGHVGKDNGRSVRCLLQESQS